MEIQSISMNSKSVRQAFRVVEPTDANIELCQALYEAARVVETSTMRIAVISDNIKESLDRIAAGGVPFYNITNEAIDLDRTIAAKKSGADMFRLLARLNGITVTE